MQANTIDQLEQAIKQKLTGSPYVLTRTDNGLDLSVNLADATFYGIVNVQHLTHTYVHHIKLTANGGYTITDDEFELNWALNGQGVKKVSLGAQTKRQIGTIKTWQHETIIAIKQDGAIGKAVSYTLNSEEGRRIIVQSCDELGLKKQMDTYTKIGLYVALATLLFVVVPIVILTILGAI